MALVAFAAVVPGIIIAGSLHIITGILAGSNEEMEYPDIIKSDITGNWTYSSENDFRFLRFSGDYTFTFEQWTLRPYTTHITYKGVWGKTKQNTYMLYPDIIRPDIPALHSPYILDLEDTGISACSILTDNLKRKYYPEEYYAGGGCTGPGRHETLELEESEYLASEKRHEERIKDEKDGLLHAAIEYTLKNVFGWGF